MGREQPSDAQFTRWVGAGKHREAAAWLVNHFAEEVLGLCLAMVRDRSAAEDLAQDAFGRAFVGLEGFRGEASPRTWLLKIARNRCIDHLRSRERKPWDDPSANGGEPELMPDETPLPSDLLLRRDDVEDALARLNAIERALVVLRFRNGLDYAELATAFGLGEGAVRMRLSRALARMRHTLEAKHEVVPAPTVVARASRAAPAPAPPPASAADSVSDFFAEEATGERAAAAPFEAELDEAAEAPPGAPALGDAVLGSAGGAPAEPSAQAMRARAAPGAPRQVAAEAEKTAAFEQNLAATDALLSVPPARRGAGLISRLVDLFHREPVPLPSPPVEHPLTAYFAATRETMPAGLRSRLLERAHALNA